MNTTSNDSPSLFLRNFDHSPQYHNSSLASLSAGVNSSDSRPPSSLSSVGSPSQYPRYSLQDVQHLREENIILKTKLETLQWVNFSHFYSNPNVVFLPYRGAFNSLIQSIGPGQSIAQSSQLPKFPNHQQFNVKTENPLFSSTCYFPSKPLLQKDYPNIKYWYKHEWSNSKLETVASSEPGERGRSRAAQGKNVTMGFVEDIDGEPIDGHRATNIRRVTRQVWGELAASGLAPKTWSKIGISALTQFRQQVYEQFPELSYCDNHWKLDRLATDTYSQWDGDKSSGSSESIPAPKKEKRGSTEHDLRPSAKKQKPGSKLKKSNGKWDPVFIIDMTH